MSKNNSIVLTKVQRQIIHEALAIEAEEAQKAGSVGYMARVLTQATMPHRDPKERFFDRSNGLLTVSLVDVNNVGLPYGALPRLLLAWITTEAVLKKDRNIVLGESLSQFMRELDLAPTGGRWGSITRLKEQMGRLFSCAIGYKVEDDSGLHLAQTSISKEVHLWWDPKSPEQTTVWDSYVELSKDFYDEIVERPIPVDLRALRALKRSPMSLDIYTWLTYRMSYLSKTTAISWEQLQLQMGAGYAYSDRGRTNFQQAFKKNLKSVLVVYPDAQVSQERGRLILKPSNTHITKRTK